MKLPDVQPEDLFYDEQPTTERKNYKVRNMFLRKLCKYTARVIIVAAALLVVCGAAKSGSQENRSGSRVQPAIDADQIIVTDLVQRKLVSEATEPEKPKDSTQLTVHDIDEADMQWYVKVNRALNTVTVYTETFPGSGEFDYPYLSFAVSVGLGNNTRLGTYTVGASANKEWRYEMQQMEGGSWTQWDVRFESSRLFHSPTYAKPRTNADGSRTFRYDTMSTSMFNNLGNAASHGCIRMRTGDAYWMYMHLREGDTVEIYSDYDDPGPLGKPTIQRITAECPAPYRTWDPTDPNENNPWRTATEEQLAKWLVDAEYDEVVNPGDQASDDSQIAKRAIALVLNSGDGVLHLNVNPTYEQIKANFVCQYNDATSPMQWNLYFEGPHDLETPGQYVVTAYAMDVTSEVTSERITVIIQVTDGEQYFSVEG